MAKPIGTLGVIDTLTIGGRVFTDLTTILCLYTKGTSTNRCTFRLYGSQSGAGYVVTGGKTLRIYAYYLQSPSASVVSALIAQTDNDIGLGAATAFSNPIYFGTESSTTADPIQIPAATTQSQAASPLGKVLAGKYLSLDNNGGGTSLVTAYGYET